MTSYEPAPDTRDNFRREIIGLLDEVPAEQWDDVDVRGVLYDFVPWHRSSSVTIHTYGDDPTDIADWKYYFSAESDGQLLEQEFQAYENANTDRRLVYHKLLIEAAKALLEIDYSKYCNPLLSTPVLNLRNWNAIDDNFCLNKTFLLQVYDPDQSFLFNYCEYVVAMRHETI